MNENDIAIVGMATRLPGSRNNDELWQNLVAGRESVRRYEEAELLAAGVTKEALRRPSYVRAGAPLDRMEHFDAEFFGFSPKEAAIMDPQHRQFLETCWEALDDAGHPPERFDGAVGVFAGCGMNGYFMFNLLSNPDIVRDVGLFLLRHTGNDKDFLATRVSYLLNLKGPSINVQTACSTSLVAIHTACQHLLSGECDMALAGGVTIEMPHRRGYHYEEGEILSPDGHCRAFDHRSKGTVFGSGAGVVVLRRLKDAIADGDAIHAVIKGTAVNNDGSQKVGYLAPSVDGQAACIAEALAVADVDARSIGYVECHGTGTPMGDPIEVSALTQAFRASTDEAQFCGIGSIKTNIGHLDTAAGVAGLAKAALALANGAVPPSLNWEKPNPQIDFAASPFYVNDALRPWPAKKGTPRRAGVNSLGVGGTNAFAILEEAPARAAGSKPRRRHELLVISGKSRAALDENTRNLARALEANPALELADVAHTLQVGRRAFSERRVLAAADRAEAIQLLQSLDPKRVFTHTATAARLSVAFLFPGGGAQYPRMARDLYDHEPVSRQVVDDGLRILETKHGVALRAHLLCERDDAARSAAATALEKPSLQLPAIFLVEMALTKLLAHKGVVPQALLGHSMGENTAACVSGTMTFDECLGLVALRGRLMDRVDGGMVVVPLPPAELQPVLDELGLDLASVNAPELCVASGSAAQLALLEAQMKARGVEVTRIKINIAAHSRLLDPVLAEFRAYASSMKLSAPTIPWVSNRTGAWITKEQATSPAYWVEHLRGSVRFADGVATLASDAGRVFVEVGPGKTLSSLARMHPAVKPSHACVPAMRHAEDGLDDGAVLTTLLGRVWAAGGALDERAMFGDEKRLRVRLPAYAFQSVRYFIEPGTKREAASDDAAKLIDRDQDPSRWFWETAWRRRDADDGADGKVSRLVFLDDVGVGRRLVDRWRERGDDVVVVRASDSFQQIADDEYRLAPEHGRSGFDSLLRELVRTGRLPDRVSFLWLLGDEEKFRPGSSWLHRNQERGFYSVLFFAQAWAAEGLKRALHVDVVSCGMQRVGKGQAGDDEVRWPEQATVLGPARVMTRELAGVTCTCIDVDARDLVRPRSAAARIADAMAGLDDVAELVERSAPQAIVPSVSLLRKGARARAAAATSPCAAVADALAVELSAPPATAVVALRGGGRFVEDLRRVTMPAGASSAGDAASLPVREGGVVLVTGGLGGIGLTIAEHLVAVRRARLALLSRTALPERSAWAETVRKLGAAHPTAKRIRAVERLERAGAEVLLVHGDVTDLERMKQVVAEIRARFGALHCVLHAAGVLRDGLILGKSQSDVEEVLAPKVYGTLVVDQATQHEDLDLFAVFSSTSTATAPVGQVDYVAANAFLKAFAEGRKGKGKSLALHWGIWSDVGMAADAVAQSAGASASGSVPAGAPLACAHPLFDHKSTDDRGTTTLHARWSEQQWFLDEHRTRAGDALLPGAAYLELARGALAELGLVRPFEMNDLVFFRPLDVEGERAVRCRLVPTEGGYFFEVHQGVTLEGATAEGGAGTQRTGWRKTGHVTIGLHELAPRPSTSIEALRATCTKRGAKRTRQEDHLRFGPRWRVVEECSLGDGCALARLQLPEAYAAEAQSFALHPALVDLGTGFAMDLIDGYDGDQLWVPVGYRSIKVYAPLPPQCWAYARVGAGSAQAAGFASFDVQIVDDAGRVCLEVQELSLKRLSQPLDLGRGRRIAPADVELDEPAAPRPLSPGELALRHNLEQGIRSEEGVQAFVRAATSWSKRHLFVSSLDLAALVAQTDAAAKSQAPQADAEPGQRFARPALAADYREPSNDIERTLVSMWQDLLGVDQIGVNDSFFDLGGHSLIAVRLFAKVKKSFSVDFPISVLFEAPTIGAIASLVAAAMPEGAAGRPAGSDAAVRAAPATRRYKHLVAMQPAEGGPRTPFFLVAGMFGNVLNLRHLAHQVGTERPFYGIQARGLFGGDAPHETFEEMAADYLAEVRLVQPHGPYLLGGFSGGGIAAVEMARQLREQGETVALLALLDTPLPRSEELTRKDKLEMHLRSLKQDGADWFLSRVKARVAWEIERRRPKGEAPAAEAVFHSQVIEAAFYRATSRYQLRRHEGRITLFRPKLAPIHVFDEHRMIDKDRRFIYADNGWGRFSDGVDVYEVPGTHDSMVLEPNVRVLAARLRKCIHEVESSAVAYTEPQRRAAE